MTIDNIGSVTLAIDEGGIATLSFNRPSAMNTLDVSTASAFHDACREISVTTSVRAVIIRGEGRAFGAGGDLTELQRDAGEAAVALIDHMHAGIKLLTGINAPVIASVHGVVAGGSLSLSLACDLAIAAEGTKFNMAYANVAASCDVSGSWSLPRMIGLRHALQIALLSDTFDAQEALRLGLVNRVVPPGTLAEETRALAERLAAGPTLAYGRMKRLMRQSFENDFASQLDAERDAFMACVDTADFKEALSAFFSKRKASFRGQ